MPAQLLRSCCGFCAAGFFRAGGALLGVGREPPGNPRLRKRAGPPLGVVWEPPGKPLGKPGTVPGRLSGLGPEFACLGAYHKIPRGPLI